MKQSNNIFSLRKRLLAVCCAVTFIFCLLFGRLAYLQINSYSYLQNYALDQWTRDLPIRANRGQIYDRNGVLLATNESSYDIYLRPRMVEDDEYTALQRGILLLRGQRGDGEFCRFCGFQHGFHKFTSPNNVPTGLPSRIS